MLIKNASEVPAQAVQEGIDIRWLIAKQEGAPNFAMRVVEIQPGVVFAPHHHPYEHEIYVLEGAGIITNPDGNAGNGNAGNGNAGNGNAGIMQPGVFILVPPDEVHGYQNTSEQPLKFICVIPLPD
jgi:quercetin dioxygenase-like cupin family protein